MGVSRSHLLSEPAVGKATLAVGLSAFYSMIKCFDLEVIQTSSFLEIKTGPVTLKGGNSSIFSGITAEKHVLLQSRGGLFFFLGTRTWHMEVPRLGVEWELQLLAYAPATAMPDPSLIFDLHHSLW